MKYTESIEIKLPRAQVVRLISDVDSIPKWLRGIISHEPINGKHGEVGTVSRIVFEGGGKDSDVEPMEATETVVRLEPENLDDLVPTEPVHYDRELESQGMWSMAKERFIEVSPKRTLWESENEYRFAGLSMRMAAPFLKGSFRRQQRKHMKDFKAFAERGIDVRLSK